MATNTEVASHKNCSIVFRNAVWDTESANKS